MRNVILLLTLSLTLAGCMATYTLVSPGSVPVAQGAMKVQAGIAWNKSPKTPLDIRWEENWTQNGPLLDTVTFIGGLPEGEAIASQRPKDERKVSVFRATMMPQDLASMIESYYRIKAGATVFETTGVKPVTFVGQSGIQFDYDYLGADEVKRRGRAIVAVVANKLYFMSLEAAAIHYFDAALPQFEAMVASASIS